MTHDPGETAGDDGVRAGSPSRPAAARRPGGLLFGVAGLVVLGLAFSLLLCARAGTDPSKTAPGGAKAGREAPAAAVKPPKPVAPPVVAAESTAATAVAPADTTAPRRLIAYYFRTTKRCPSCLKIEGWSREAIEAAFPPELKSGRLVWRMVNVEEKGNEHFVKDYQLFTKSVVLVDEVKGRQARWKNLDKVWELLGDKEDFQRYVTAETRGYLAANP